MTSRKHGGVNWRAVEGWDGLRGSRPNQMREARLAVVRETRGSELLG